VKGDPGRVRQVLMNLVGNAVKFTDEGEVVVRVEVLRDDGVRCLVRIEVVDTGIGLTPEQQSGLFQSFSQVDTSSTRRYGGTGLGLAISKQLVELMGGEVGHESELGVGSKFWFTCPLQKGDVTDPMFGVESLTGLKVLVVDDNETNRFVLDQTLQLWGMHVTSVADARSALEKLRGAAEGERPYDVAVLDYNMPGLNGIDLARAISTDPEIDSTRLVLLTSSGQRGEVPAAQEAGVLAYLTKPVRQSSLYDCLATVMGYKDENRPARVITQHTINERQARSRAHVLVVEDNLVNQKVAVRMLERMGYRADVAADGLQAVDAVTKGRYAAVLMDCQMPEMDGYEATRSIRKLEVDSRRTPIIAMTAGAMKSDQEKCFAAGMDDYVPKPVRFEDLEAVLARWIGASPRNDAPLDPDAIKMLRSIDDDEGFLQGLARDFISDSEAIFSDLGAAMGRGDRSLVAQLCHRLKGASANIGAHGLVAACDRLETAALNGGHAGWDELLAETESELHRVHAALRALEPVGNKESI
jgi:two-component system sensor histidine kinase/response regulator